MPNKRTGPDNLEMKHVPSKDERMRLEEWVPPKKKKKKKNKNTAYTPAVEAKMK